MLTDTTNNNNSSSSEQDIQAPSTPSSSSSSLAINTNTNKEGMTEQGGDVSMGAGGVVSMGDWLVGKQVHGVESCAVASRCLLRFTYLHILTLLLSD